MNYVCVIKLYTPYTSIIRSYEQYTRILYRQMILCFNVCVVSYESCISFFYRLKQRQTVKKPVLESLIPWLDRPPSPIIQFIIQCAFIWWWFDMMVIPWRICYKNLNTERSWQNWQLSWILITWYHTLWLHGIVQSFHSW